MGETKECPDCLGDGVLYFEVDSATGEPANETEVCVQCEGSGRLPITESDLEELYGQLRLTD